MDQNLFTDSLALHVSETSTLYAVGNQAFASDRKSIVKLPRGGRHKKVHGFELSQQVVLVYGENEFSLFTYKSKSESDNFQMLYEGETKDWIGTAKFLPDEEGCQFILHMAHSAMLRIQFVQNTELKYVHAIMIF
ncbi:uncharacterized protein LOC108605575 isoform X3 [Drosophila busckii]|uniref:uncharacterized protein LOC108605575 isoform X3 n=1 Tax=Drosophila busckii TaxID=30019 RepID=UPI00083F4C4F|nr:uncharacterized protein LOC108605575 isoform X3 [Drosophila busckii]